MKFKIKIWKIKNIQAKSYITILLRSVWKRLELEVTIFKVFLVFLIHFKGTFNRNCDPRIGTLVLPRSSTPGPHRILHLSLHTLEEHFFFNYADPVSFNTNLTVNDPVEYLLPRLVSCKIIIKG